MTLAWTPSSDPTVVGYNLYYGVTSGVYTSEISAANATNTLVTGLVEGTTYYFAATAYDTNNIESPLSNEASYAVPLPVNPGNSQPTLNALGALTINENAGSQTVNLSGITSGAANESQTLTVTASSSNTALIPTPTVTYTSANSTGSIAFAPVNNAYGSATITVTVNDGGASNNIVSKSFTVTVNAVNNQPTLNALGALTINENAGSQTVNLSGITSGAANESQTLTVTASSSNTALIPTPTVTYTSANSTGSIAFAPVNNAYGSATITVTVNDGGASNNIVSKSFTVTVNAVNQAPTLDVLTNLSISKNAGVQSVNLSGITSGAANESQTLTVTASSSNPSLIPDPTVLYTNANTTGILLFNPTNGATGTAIITVTVDDGQAQNNTASRSFIVTVGSTNQTPTLDSISDVKIHKNSGMQALKLSGISDGATTNQVQAQVASSTSLTITAVSSDTSLIPTPTVSYAGNSSTATLSLIPATDATGSATITVTVADQATGNAVSRSFTVTVDSTSETPTLNPISDISLVQSAKPSVQYVTLSGISLGVTTDGKKPKVKITASSSNGALVKKASVKYKVLATTGTLKFKPLKNAIGTTTITVTLSVKNGGTVVKTFTVAVLAPSTNTTLVAKSMTTVTTVLPAPAILTPADHAAGQFALNLAGEADQQYVIEASENLSDWVPVYTNTAPFKFVDTQASEFKQRFYRSVQLSTP